MRPPAVLLLILAAAIGWTQQQAPPTSPQDPGAESTQVTPEETMGAMSLPQISIRVRHHSGSADIIQLTVVKQGYPEALLRDQLDQMGKMLNSPPRGLGIGMVMIDDKKNLGFLRASFAIDGIIDPVTRRLDLNSLIKPFLGAPEPYVIDSFHLIFEEETPIPNRTLDKYSDDKVSLVASFFDTPRSIEYRLMTKTQNPAEINIPVDADQKSVAPPTAVGPPRPSPMIIGLILLAGVALGALVYFAMLRSPKA